MSIYPCIYPCMVNSEKQVRQVDFPGNAKTTSKRDEQILNKYCSGQYEYIYKCPDFCDVSGNEL